MTLAGVLKRLDDLFTGLNRLVVLSMMMAMAGLVFGNVVARYVFNNSLNWTEEVARYLMIWVTYLGAGLAMREGQHVAIEYFQGLLPSRLLPYWRAFVALLILGFLAVLTIAGFQFAEFASRQRTPVLGWSKGAVYLAVPIGALAFGLHMIATLRGFIGASPQGDEEDLPAGSVPQ